MAEFKRSRLSRKNEETITKKTIFLGFLTISFAIFIVVFGLPFLIKFSVFLGETKKNEADLTEKTLAPLAPRLVIPFEATNSGEVDVNGFAEVGVIVELFNNGLSLGDTEVNNEGDFIFEDISLYEGENSFTAIASSEETGIGEESLPSDILFDNEAPEITMTNPSEKNLTIDYPDFDIIGETENGASVSVNGKLALVLNSGEFKIKIQLSTGKNDIEIIARDNAGNESKKKISITYSL